METLLEAFPLSPEFGSREHIANHIELMRKFKCILNNAEQSGGHTKAFPTPPPRILGQEDEEAKWRVQCLLMSAEVRYSMYLKMLEKWIKSHGIKSPKDEWPLPPWDVAIIFYAHLLSPFNFQGDIEKNFPSLWKAEIEFPLARILSTNTDEDSQRVWRKEYPNIAYQIVEFTPAGDPTYVTENAMDIHGYKCIRTECAAKGAHVIPMINWAQYRVSSTDLLCPGCKHRIRAYKVDAALELCERQFGFTIFNLWDSPHRQFGKQGFVDRILALTLTQDQWQNHVFRYLKFLQLMKENNPNLVPTLDIDLLWHTHQLSPVAYKKYCETYVGRRINHVDTIHAAKRATRQDNTASLWATRYGESYFDPQNPEKSAEIERCKAACEKDLEDIPTKLAAYDEEHKHLKTALDNLSERTEARLADYRKAQDTATAANEEIAGIDKSIASIKPKLRLLGLRYYRKQQKKQLEELGKQRASLGELRLYKLREANSRYQGYSSASQEQSRQRGLWEEAQRERKRLEQQLMLNVTEAKAAIWRLNVDGGEQKYQEDRYNGSWYSIVPSEAQLHVHPVLDKANNWIFFYPSAGYAGYSGSGGYGGCGEGCSGGCGGGG